jgi:GNAT superfamily N-acetyltransferase
MGTKGIVMAFEQHIYRSKELPTELRCQILSFLRIAWPEGFVGENRLRNWISPEDEHPVHIVLVEAGILVSHTEVKWKNLDHAGERYKVYGLSGVFTYPAFRGEGYGTEVVRGGTKYIDEQDGDIGMFHCDPERSSFYDRCGWIPMKGSTTLEGDPKKPIVSAQLMMMCFLSEKGKRGRTAFERESVYFGETTW